MIYGRSHSVARQRTGLEEVFTWQRRDCAWPLSIESAEIPCSKVARAQLVAQGVRSLLGAWVFGLLMTDSRSFEQTRSPRNKRLLSPS